MFFALGINMRNKVKRGFVRALWGIYEHSGRRFFKRRGKLDNDIKLAQACPYAEPFRTYVFGEDNYKFLVDKGFNCKLVDKKPIVWDMNKKQFRHKLEVFKCGMEDYNEIVFLDWDCFPIKPLPDNFWEVLGKKEPIQAILRMYHRRKAYWRGGVDVRKIPCASFVYIRDKEVTLDLIKMWEKLNRPWSEEVVLARYMDERIGGWKGMDKYWEFYEPDFFRLQEARVFPVQKLNEKNQCFRHLNMHGVSKYLKLFNRGQLKQW